LAGIDPYSRGKAASKPGEELVGALKESGFLAEHFPEMHAALLRYPSQTPRDVVDRFYWINQKVENRPTFILQHRMSVAQAEGALMVAQQFYVGHSYNSMQVVAGCIPMEKGTMVFYSNRTFTDQVAGIGRGVRHTIGRSQMRGELIKSFEEIRAQLTNP
jgi:hypothetical protein